MTKEAVKALDPQGLRVTHVTGEMPRKPRRVASAERFVMRLLADAEPRPPSAYDRAPLYWRAVREWARHGALKTMSPADLRKLPWAMFYSPHGGVPRDRWLGSKPELVREYGQWLGSGYRMRPLLAFLREFLDEYPIELPTFEQCRRLLQGAMEKVDRPRWPLGQKWARRVKAFRLLDGDSGRGFVQGFLSSETSCDKYLRDSGVDPGLSHSRFLRSGIRASLPTVNKRLKASPGDVRQLRRLLELLEFENELRFRDAATRLDIAAALLSPFVERSPSPEAKRILQEFFIERYGHPVSSSKWWGIPEAWWGVLLRWLVQRDLDHFFRLLKETALDRHWRYRQAFWLAFHEAKLIEETWFALGKRAGELLTRESDDPNILEKTGRLVGAQAAQSILLMRMRGVVVAEWSHAGSCHMWIEGKSGAPSLFKRKYQAVKLRRSLPYKAERRAFSQRHHGSAMGRWQDAIARWLRDAVGVRVPRRRYFPLRLREATHGRAK